MTRRPILQPAGHTTLTATEKPPIAFSKESKMNFPFEKVTVVGLGYIGLPTATVVAHKGIKVQGLDVSQNIVDNSRKLLFACFAPFANVAG